MFDAQGRILLFNERYSELLGRPGLPLKGRLLVDVLTDLKSSGQWEDEPEELVAGLIAEAHAGNTATRTVIQNGRSIRIVDQPMKGGGWVATFEDITEWQQAQEQISHMARPRRAGPICRTGRCSASSSNRRCGWSSAATSLRCCASISTTSRKSTTRSAIRSATPC